MGATPKSLKRDSAERQAGMDRSCFLTARIGRNVHALKGRNEHAVLPLPDVDSLFGDKRAHVYDLHDLAFAVGFERRPAQPKLDGAPLTLLAGRQVVGAPLPANFRACNGNSPLIVAARDISIE